MSVMSSPILSSRSGGCASAMPLVAITLTGSCRRQTANQRESNDVLLNPQGTGNYWKLWHPSGLKDCGEEAVLEGGRSRSQGGAATWQEVRMQAASADTVIWQAGTGRKTLTFFFSYSSCSCISLWLHLVGSQRVRKPGNCSLLISGSQATEQREQKGRRGKTDFNRNTLFILD